MRVAIQHPVTILVERDLGRGLAAPADHLPPDVEGLPCLAAVVNAERRAIATLLDPGVGRVDVGIGDSPRDVVVATDHGERQSGDARRGAPAAVEL